MTEYKDFSRKKGNLYKKINIKLFKIKCFEKLT